MNNSIIDLIIRIKNAYLARKEKISSPHSGFKEDVTKKLKELGYLKSYQIQKDGSKKNILLELIYEDGVPALTDVKIISRPGRRWYVGKKELKKVKALHGLYRTLISNAMQGVVTPWQKRLEIVGTGYNAKMQGEDLALKVGYSHPIVFKKVTGIKFQVDGNNIIIISGVDKQLVGQVAHQIKTNKKPDPYKGKGIRYEGERLKLKPGKKAKTAGAA